MAQCPICDRELIPGSTTNEHHLIPKSLGGKEVILIHCVCHQKIHSLFSERELKKEYFTVLKLRQHPEMQKFIKWIQKKPPTFMDKNIRANRRK